MIGNVGEARLDLVFIAFIYFVLVIETLRQ
jgi:hypothetical protein